MSAANYEDVDDEDDVWFVPEDVGGPSSGKDGSSSTREKFDAEIRVSPLSRMVERDTAEARFMSKLNYREDEMKVEMTEVKTYGCLRLLLDDLLMLLERFKEASKDPAHYRFLVYLGDEGEQDLAKMEEEARERVLERRRRLNMSQEEKQTGMAAMGFYRAFEDIRDFDRLSEAVQSMKDRVQGITATAGEKSKVNTKEGEEAVLEDDLVTDAFASASDLARAVLRVLFQDEYREYAKSIKISPDKDEFGITHRTRGFLQACSVLQRLLDGESSSKDTNVASLLKRGHYRIKQLQPMSVTNRTGGARGICGQSAGLVVMAKVVGQKIILQVWDTVRRKVKFTVSSCHFGCRNVAAFVIKDELFVVFLTVPKPGRFFYYLMRGKMDSQINEQRLDINSWPHPVLAREVATHGIGKQVTFHMLDQENGDLTWLAMFNDESGTNVAFFNPANGEEVGRGKLGGANASVEAIKGGMAIVFDGDSKEFLICKFVERCVRIMTKIPMKTAFVGLDEEKCKYGKQLKATFDQTNSDSFLLVSPQGDATICDTNSLEVKWRRRKVLAEFQSHRTDDYEDEWRVAHPNEFKGRLQGYGKRGEKHCLVSGVLFYLVRHGGSCRLMATDLQCESQGVGSTVQVCQFALDHSSGDVFGTGFDGEEVDEFSGSNIKVDKKSTGYFVPYAYSKVMRQYNPLRDRFRDRSGISYMWTLLAGSMYRLHYCQEAETLYIAKMGDNNFVEVKFLRENANSIRARHVKKQREVQAKWKIKGRLGH